MSQNTWLHRVVRHGVRPLAPTRLRPNHVTGARLAFGLGACACFATGKATGLASLLFLISFLLDRADGELARLSGRVSDTGHYYDLASDALCNCGVLIAIGVGLRAGPFADWAMVMGLVAGLGVAAAFTLIARVELTRGCGTVRFAASRGFDPDDAMLAIPLAMLMGWGEGLIVSAALGGPLSALFIWWKLRAHLAGTATQS